MRGKFARTILLSALSVVAFPAATFAEAATFTITDGGQAQARIVIGGEPPGTVAFAARELRDFVKKMSGAELQIGAEPQPGVPSVRLGPAALETLGPEALDGVGRDGYVIVVRDGDLCVFGIDETGPHTDIEALLEQGVTHDVAAWNFHRGTLYGTYRLLEELGMRWFMPGELGERAPDRPTLSFRGEIRENPHFISRTVSYWSLGRAGVQFRADWESITIPPGERAAIGFMAKDNRMWELRMRGESFRIPLNHNPPRARWSGRFGESNPEYFALATDGTRMSGEHQHLCYTNPGMIKENIRDARAFAGGQDAHERGIMTDFPYNRNWHTAIAMGNSFSLLPSDGFRPCQCDDCRAKVVTDTRESNQRHSRLVWDVVAEVAREVPEANITCLAYGSYSVPYPGMEKLPDNVVVGFCAYSNPARLYYRDNFQRLEDLLERWAALTDGNMAFWQHYLSSNRGEETVGMPEHLPEMYARTIRTLAQYGNHAFCEMMADSIMFELFNRYLLLKLFYDPTLDERELFDDFVERFYGPDAGPLIREIYEDIERKSIERFENNYAAYSVWERLFGESTMREYQEIAQRASEKAAGTEYEIVVDAFRDFYLGHMERGRQRFADPLGQLLASFNPVLSSRRVTEAPEIDGAGDEPAWRQAESVALGNTVNGRATGNRTEVRTLHNDGYLYFLVRATLPGADTHPVGPGESGLAEGIEVYLDAPRTNRGYRRVSVDLEGTVSDHRYIDDVLLEDADWRSNARAAVWRDADGYTVEISIPWSSLELTAEEALHREVGVLVVRNQANPSEPDDRQSTTSIILRGTPDRPGAFNTLELTTR